VHSYPYQIQSNTNVEESLRSGGKMDVFVTQTSKSDKAMDRQIARFRMTPTLPFQQLAIKNS